MQVGKEVAATREAIEKLGALQSQLEREVEVQRSAAPMIEGNAELVCTR
jgi:hypothetical protein